MTEIVNNGIAVRQSIKGNFLIAAARNQCLALNKWCYVIFTWLLSDN